MGSLALASENNIVLEEVKLPTGENFIYERVEDEKFVISTVRNLEGELISEVKINKETNEVEIEGEVLEEEDQKILSDFAKVVNDEFIYSSNEFVESKLEHLNIAPASANSCSYKSIGTYYGNSSVPKIGVAAFAAYLSAITKSTYAGAYAAASVVVGALPTVYYSLNDAQCYSEQYLHNRRTVKFYKDSKRTQQIGKTSVSYQKTSK